MRRRTKGVAEMMKQVYAVPELELIEIAEEDIITASPGAEAIPGADHTGDPDCLIDLP